ncbi:hypothetical protein BJ742DRAFT_833293 [Cladochytrium replicatum]|nr:hypothetical protein BJ742DRAFT_833293 [Cladochytrium replicatum]
MVLYRIVHLFSFVYVNTFNSATVDEQQYVRHILVAIRVLRIGVTTQSSMAACFSGIQVYKNMHVAIRNPIWSRSVSHWLKRYLFLIYVVFSLAVLLAMIVTWVAFPDFRGIVGVAYLINCMLSSLCVFVLSVSKVAHVRATYGLARIWQMLKQGNEIEKGVVRLTVLLLCGWVPATVTFLGVLMNHRAKDNSAFGVFGQGTFATASDVIDAAIEMGGAHFGVFMECLLTLLFISGAGLRPLLTRPEAMKDRMRN